MEQNEGEKGCFWGEIRICGAKFAKCDLLLGVKYVLFFGFVGLKGWFLGAEFGVVGVLGILGELGVVGVLGYFESL